MPWCPKCGFEHVPGCMVCANCQAPLVDKQSESGHAAHSDQAEGSGEWKLLLNVRNSLEANLLVSRLEGEGIPVLKQAQGAGQYLEVVMGSANNIDLYVPEACWPQAQSLLPDARTPASMGSDKVAAGTAVPVAANSARRNTGRNLLIALMLVPILIYLCITVYSALLGVWKSLF